MQKVLDKLFERGPDRVVISEKGLATSARLAEQDHGVTPDIVFIRDDGWTLGASKHFAKVAHALWADHWVALVRYQDYSRRR